MADKNKIYFYKMHDLVWAKMPSYCAWPGRIVEPNTPQIAKLKKSPSQHCVFFFGSNNYAWIEEKSLRPFLEFRDEMKAKGKPKELFSQAMNDIESFIENPDGFSALFEPKPTVQKKKTSPKPKKHDIEFDFDSLKSDSSVPSSPNVSKTSVSTPSAAPKRSTSVRSTEKPKIAEKTPKVIAVKRKATRESEPEPEDDLDIDEAQVPTKKPRRISQTAAASSPQKSETVLEPARRSGVAETTKQKATQRSSDEASRTVFGFIGLGIMGKAILRRLLDYGHEVVIWNRTSSQCDEFVDAYGSRCEAVPSPKDVFEQAQITFVCVADADAVKETICDGERGIIAADNQSLEKGLVMLSSIDCETSSDINNAMMMKGQVRYLEAQIQGSRNLAQEGKLTIIAAGDKSLFKDCHSFFEIISKSSHFLGEEVGLAVKMNLALQTMAGVQLSVIAEALALANSFELQLHDILEIIGISNLSSDLIMEKGEVIIQGQYNVPSMKVNTMQKDLKMALELGDSLEQPLPLVTAANETFKSAKRLGLENDDAASIYMPLNLKFRAEANGI